MISWSSGEMAKRKGLKIPYIRNTVGSSPTSTTNLSKVSITGSTDRLIICVP